jgi:DNA-binding MarR family transcriptional regulator
VGLDLTRPGREQVEERRARAAAALEPVVSALSARDRAQLAALLARLTAALR